MVMVVVERLDEGEVVERDVDGDGVGGGVHI
jgi:hypothetical protein